MEKKGRTLVRIYMAVSYTHLDVYKRQIQNSVLSKDGSASDVLGKVPGVIKERNSYEVLGKGTCLLYTSRCV